VPLCQDLHVDDAGGGGRLAELTIALSLAADLGTGQPLEHGLRTCWSAVAAAGAMGLDPEERSCVYHVALLRFLGCTADASATAALVGGDDIRFNGRLAPAVMANPAEAMRYMISRVGDDLPLPRRVGAVARVLADPTGGSASLAQHCEAASRLAGRLGMSSAVCDSLAHGYERWDGKGSPDGLAGEDIPLAVRIAVVARDVDIFAESGGWSAAAAVLANRRGRGYDPDVVDAFLDGCQEWRSHIGDDPCAAVLDVEPEPVATIDDASIDSALEAVAHFADIKSPWFLGHSTGVAALTADAACAAGCSDHDVTRVRRAALVHDIGQVGVANGVWDKPGPLTAEQYERVRMHTYLTERVLHRSELLAPYATVAAAHHERADGSGYHLGRRDDQLDPAARLLAVADAVHAMREDRPHRPALTAAEATDSLCAERDAGRFSSTEVDAVLAATGQASRPVNVPRPAGLTEREVDVLRLIARGRSNKEAARQLGISPKTVGNHVEHIYAKANVRTRAGATLFALESGLLSSTAIE
jgi:HD-GYP domain-containing protein (c-di-GMP phosphodiesterase class II)